MRSRDTHPEAYRVYIEVRRRMSPERLFELGIEASVMARRMVADGVRSRHPDYDEETVEWAVKRMRLKNDDLFRDVWPAAPLVKP